MKNVKFFRGEDLPLELHKVRVVQKLHLVPIERRLDALKEGGFNTFRLQTTDVFLDMLTDSGTNAMSDNQLAAMLRADDAYAGSQSFVRLQKAVEDVLGKKTYWVRNTCCLSTKDALRRTSLRVLSSSPVRRYP